MRVALFFAALLVASIAHAQETGGSFESEDWGSSSGSSDWGSSSGSSDWGSSGSSDYGSSDYGSSSYPSTDYDTSSTPSYSPGSSDPDAGLIFVLAMIAAVVFVPIFSAFVAQQMRVPPSSRAYGPDYVPVVGPRATAGLVDVSALQLAIDWGARKFVQAELAKLAQRGDTQSKEGRRALLQATTAALQSVKLAWLYAGARNFRPMQQQLAQTEFKRIVADVRASFRQEIVRASAGRVVSVEAVGVSAKEHEGAGVVLVSIIVAARREIFDVDANRATSIESLFASLRRLRADEIVALSVVWTPAAEQDRMSTAELEARNPHLVKIGDIGGRVFCAYCHGPHAEELAKCPHCGAPTGSGGRA